MSKISKFEDPAVPFLPAKEYRSMLPDEENPTDIADVIGVPSVRVDRREADGTWTPVCRFVDPEAPRGETHEYRVVPGGVQSEVFVTIADVVRAYRAGPPSRVVNDAYKEADWLRRLLHRISEVSP